VVAKWSLPDAPNTGEPYTADVKWTYTRFTTGKTYEYSVSETQTNFHVSDAVEVETPATVHPFEPLWVAKPVGVGAVSQLWIAKGERSGLLMRIAVTERVSLVRMKS
jgi:hypothetical protein